MSKYHSYLNSAKSILQSYKGDEPFSEFIRKFFSKEKKYGSRDRKTIRSLCFYYFRLGGLFDITSYEERILAGLFIMVDTPNELLEHERTGWNAIIALSIKEKISWLNLQPLDIFPFNSKLSVGIDHTAFNLSFLIQPRVYIRVRPGQHAIVEAKLLEAKIEFEKVNEQCISFSPDIKLEQTLQINREVVIQDLNSQRVGELLPIDKLPKQAKVWDCCAASGGKSIMLYDLVSNIRLTVSDIRQTIINNLKKRFSEAGIRNYKSYVIDLLQPTLPGSDLNNASFDLIICDAPCSGSGTWSRTPEQLVFFKEKDIVKYSNLQKTIVSNVIPLIKEGGYLLYITCSVFRAENEEVVEFIREKFKLRLIEMKLFTGYTIKADTMFAALFYSE